LDDYSESIPAFICIITMPFAYSISDGIAFGLVSYTLINLFSGKLNKITIGMGILALLFIVKYFI
jgi:AGZA family xanthine/uracil permease-like MFS transporter